MIPIAPKQQWALEHHRVQDVISVRHPVVSTCFLRPRCLWHSRNIEHRFPLETVRVSPSRNKLEIHVSYKGDDVESSVGWGSGMRDSGWRIFKDEGLRIKDWPPRLHCVCPLSWRQQYNQPKPRSPSQISTHHPNLCSCLMLSELRLAARWSDNSEQEL